MEKIKTVTKRFELQLSVNDQKKVLVDMFDMGESRSVCSLEIGADDFRDEWERLDTRGSFGIEVGMGIRKETIDVKREDDVANVTISTVWGRDSSRTYKITVAWQDLKESFENIAK